MAAISSRLSKPCRRRRLGWSSSPYARDAASRFANAASAECYRSTAASPAAPPPTPAGELQPVGFGSGTAHEPLRLRHSPDPRGAVSCVSLGLGVVGDTGLHLQSVVPASGDQIRMPHRHSRHPVRGQGCVCCRSAGRSVPRPAGAACCQCRRAQCPGSGPRSG